MSIISRVPVTLTPDETETIIATLSAYARHNYAFARRTKSASLRSYSESEGDKARDLEASIVRRMYVHTDQPKG